MKAHLRCLGKHPITVDREVPGYLTNRLQFALLREAVNCLVEGVASAESIEGAALDAYEKSDDAHARWRRRRHATVLDSFSGAIDGWWQALGKPTRTPEVKNELLKAAEGLTFGQPRPQSRRDP